MNITKNIHKTSMCFPIQGVLHSFRAVASPQAANRGATLAWRLITCVGRGPEGEDLRDDAYDFRRPREGLCQRLPAGFLVAGVEADGRSTLAHSP